MTTLSSVSLLEPPDWGPPAPPHAASASDAVAAMATVPWTVLLRMSPPGVVTSGDVWCGCDGVPRCVRCVRCDEMTRGRRDDGAGAPGRRGRATGGCYIPR